MQNTKEVMMWIKDLQGGRVRKYGSDHHDSLRISDDGKTLSYENLQNGDGSRYGDYRFVTDEQGLIPSEDMDYVRHGADAYFNIGGFKNEAEWVPLNVNEKNIKRPIFRCSHCGAEFQTDDMDFDYCPRCGHHMTRRK